MGRRRRRRNKRLGPFAAGAGFMKRGFRRRPAHWVTLAVLVALVVLARTVQRHRFAPVDDRPRLEQLAEGEYRLDRVVDGDTIIVLAGGERVRVRLLSIDTPEVFQRDAAGRLYEDPQPFAREATEFTKEFLAGGRARLQFGRRRVDRYQRLLAYVFVEDRLLNEELVRAGLARTMIFPGDESSLTNRLKKAEQEAQQAQRGIWSQ